MSESLLVNFWYAPPVGHAIEALHYCLGYHRADPSKQITLILNAETPLELASCCPFVDTATAVRFPFLEAPEDALPDFGQLQRVYDWIIEDARRWEPRQLEAFPGFQRYYQAASDHFTARRGLGPAGSAPPEFARHQNLRLDLPVEARRRAAEATTPAIAVLPTGSGGRARYPSLRSWQLVLGELLAAFPTHRVVLVGKLVADDRTASSFTREEFDELLGLDPRVGSAVDIGLLDQLAVVEVADIFLSPHSGFGMAALAVGTPWLTLGGGMWFEYFFNRVPFVSIVPDLSRYPAYDGWRDALVPFVDDDGDGPRTPAMTGQRIREDLGRLLSAAAELIAGRLDYEACLAQYFHDLHAALGDPGRIFSIDGIHRDFIPPPE